MCIRSDDNRVRVMCITTIITEFVNRNTNVTISNNRGKYSSLVIMLQSELYIMINCVVLLLLLLFLHTYNIIIFVIIFFLSFTCYIFCMTGLLFVHEKLYYFVCMKQDQLRTLN